MAAPLLENLSESLGSPEPAVRLLLSILIGEFPPRVVPVAARRAVNPGDMFSVLCGDR